MLESGTRVQCVYDSLQIVPYGKIAKVKAIVSIIYCGKKETGDYDEEARIDHVVQSEEAGENVYFKSDSTYMAEGIF